MIKRAYIFFVLALLCAVAVFGTGFALWYYNSQSSYSHNMGVKVTESTVLGSFTVPEINLVVLDGGTGAGINPTITGVSFYKTDENGVALTDNSFEISFTVNEKYRQQINENGNYDKVNFGIRIDVPEQLKGLITHTEFYSERIAGKDYIDLKALTVELTDHFNDADGGKSDFKYDNATGVFTFTLTTTTLNRFFTYSAGREPTSLSGYESLKGNFAPCFIIELWQGV